MRLMLFILCLSACTPMVSTQGHIQKEAQLEALQTGTPKEEVLQQFGSPSSMSRFGDETWYYIRARKEAHAFFKPEITDQQVIGVVFDTGGTVREVQHYDINDRQQVVMVDDVTPTEGHSISFIEQALGNIGRFNSSGVDHTPTPRGPGR